MPTPWSCVQCPGGFPALGYLPICACPVEESLPRTLGTQRDKTPTGETLALLHPQRPSGSGCSQERENSASDAVSS